MCFKRFGINRRCVVCFLAADSNGSCEQWVWWEEARCQDLLHTSCCVVPRCDVVGWDAAIPLPSHRHLPALWIPVPAPRWKAVAPEADFVCFTALWVTEGDRSQHHFLSFLA